MLFNIIIAYSKGNKKTRNFAKKKNFVKIITVNFLKGINLLNYLVEMEKEY